MISPFLLFFVFWGGVGWSGGDGDSNCTQHKPSIDLLSVCFLSAFCGLMASVRNLLPCPIVWIEGYLP